MLKDYIGKKVVVRGIQSGVYFGTLKERNGQEVELTNCRNIWSWQGANNLLQIAAEGVKRPNDCRISMAVEDIVFTDIVEIIPLTDAAIVNLEGVAEWKY